MKTSYIHVRSRRNAAHVQLLVGHADHKFVVRPRISTRICSIKNYLFFFWTRICISITVMNELWVFYNLVTVTSSRTVLFQIEFSANNFSPSCPLCVHVDTERRHRIPNTILYAWSATNKILNWVHLLGLRITSKKLTIFDKYTDLWFRLPRTDRRPKRPRIEGRVHVWNFRTYTFHGRTCPSLNRRKINRPRRSKRQTNVVVFRSPHH